MTDVSRCPECHRANARTRVRAGDVWDTLDTDTPRGDLRIIGVLLGVPPGRFVREVRQLADGRYRITIAERQYDRRYREPVEMSPRDVWPRHYLRKGVVQQRSRSARGRARRFALALMCEPPPGCPNSPALAAWDYGEGDIEPLEALREAIVRAAAS